MVPTVSSLLAQVTSTSGMAVPSWSKAVTMNLWVSPIARVAPDGVTRMLVRTGSVCSSGLTVIAALPDTPSAVAVMAAIPSARAVKVPVSLMVPTVSLLLVQVTSTSDSSPPNWSRTVAVNSRVSLTVAMAVSGVTVMLVVTGSSAVTVTVASADLFSAVAVMVTVPSARAVKRPVSLIVPTVSFPLAQATETPVMALPNWSRAVAENCSVPLISRVAVVGATVMLSRTGSSALTVTAALPVTPPAVAVTSAVPSANAVKSPFSSTVPTVSLLLVHATETPVMALPNWSRAVAENCSVPLISRVAVAGVTVMLSRISSVALTVTFAVEETPAVAAVMVAVPAAAALK